MVMQMPQAGGGAPPQTSTFGGVDFSDPAIQKLFGTLNPRYASGSNLNPLLDAMRGGQDVSGLEGGYNTPGGGAYTVGRGMDVINNLISQFQNQYKSVAGSDPNQTQLDKFISEQVTPMARESGPGGFDPLNTTNIQKAIQNYIPTAFAPEIQSYQQQQQSDALGKNISSGEDLISKAMGKFSANLTDPNNPMYQQFSGQMNNMGISPSSGAFQAGLGGTIANQGQQLQQQLMSSLGFPALQGIQGLSSQANNAMNQAQPGAQNDLYGRANQNADFTVQQQMAKALMEQMQPSGFQTAMGEAGAGAQAFGNVMGGVKSAKSTWICTAMVEHGVMTKDEVQKLHDHLFKAFWKKPFKFLGYFMFGKLLVWLSESVNTHWSIWKPEFYQNVMAESDPVKAVDLYEQAFWNLYNIVRERKALQWHSTIQ